MNPPSRLRLTLRQREVLASLGFVLPVSSSSPRSPFFPSWRPSCSVYGDEDCRAVPEFVGLSNYAGYLNATFWDTISPPATSPRLCGRRAAVGAIIAVLISPTHPAGAFASPLIILGRAHHRQRRPGAGSNADYGALNALLVQSGLVGVIPWLTRPFPSLNLSSWPISGIACLLSPSSSRRPGHHPRRAGRGRRRSRAYRLAALPARAPAAAARGFSSCSSSAP